MAQENPNQPPPQLTPERLSFAGRNPMAGRERLRRSGAPVRANALRRLAAATLAGWLALVPGQAPAQTAGTPVYALGGDTDWDRFLEDAEKLRQAGALRDETKLTNQFHRAHCQLPLSPPRTRPLSGRELCATARAAHIRIGWYYYCTKPAEWRLTLDGGYALTKDGAVGTCFHVIQPPEYFRNGYLVAADESGRLYPVTEILAVNTNADVAIVRVAAKNFSPLALTPEAQPGDRCVCFSDPDGQRSYFTEGLVSRFIRTTDHPPVVQFNHTLDEAAGSSGSALLDTCGNIIGQIEGSDPIFANWPDENADKAKAGKNDPPPANGAGKTSTDMIVHRATSAREVLALIRQK